MRWPAALIVTDCTFTANAAPWNATAGLDHLHYSSGGAIYVDRTTALVYYSLFRENTAAGHGGAIALVGDGRDTSYLRVQSSKFNENEGRLASAIYVYRGDSYFKSNKVYEDRIPQTFALGFNATAYGCHNDELNITAGEEAFAYCDADSSSGINVVEALIALIAIIVGCVLGGALCWFVAAPKSHLRLDFNVSDSFDASLRPCVRSSTRAIRPKVGRINFDSTELERFGRDRPDQCGTGSSRTSSTGTASWAGSARTSAPSGARSTSTSGGASASAASSS